MTFLEAMSLARQGKKVAREAWSDHKTYVACDKNGLRAFLYNAVKPNEWRYEPYEIWMYEIEASDWRVVEEEK